MFGLFESKEAKLIREDTKRTISNADSQFNEKQQKEIAKRVFSKICKYISEIDGLGLGSKRDEIMRNQMNEIKLERQNNIDEKEFGNPEWMVAALVESYLMMNSGVYGKKLGKEAENIMYWCRAKLSDKEIQDILSKFTMK
jgi:hypothetical protein